MKISKLVGAASIIALSFGLAAGLSGCTQSTPVIAPITKDVGDLQGTTVDLVVGQVLNVNTDSLPVGSYSATIEDPTVVEFVKGRVDGGTTYNPGFTALAEGTTKVVMSNSEGGIEDLTFTIEVTPN